MSAAAQARARSTAAVFAEAPVMNIKWRASATPTRGGLKLAESPPAHLLTWSDPVSHHSPDALRRSAHAFRCAPFRAPFGDA